MNKKAILKSYIPTILAVIVYLAVFIVFYVGDKFKTSDLYTFIGLTLGLPIVIALIDGIITGSITKSFKDNMLNILISTVLLGGVIILITLVVNSTVGMDLLMENTKMQEGINLSVNSGLTVGSVVQPMMIILVVKAIGTFAGSKLSNIFSKIKS